MSPQLLMQHPRLEIPMGRSLSSGSNGLTRSLTLSGEYPQNYYQLINHLINLIDPTKRINYCLLTLKEELAEKVSQYTSTGWWVPATARQAMPMLCILKKNGKLHTVFEMHMQNENMENDVSPFPDQDTIRHDILHAMCRSKLDMCEVYKRVPKTLQP